ncbi:hypothetical protein QL285_022122 [Trifolium repens]|nr:hypothetical protein QL285_022122 [Trifolium repens]
MTQELPSSIRASTTSILFVTFGMEIDLLAPLKVKDAQILSISSETLVNLVIEDPLEKLNLAIQTDYPSNFAEIKLSTPNLNTFSFTGELIQKICRSGLSSVKQVSIDDSQEDDASVEHGLVIFNWLLDFANVESLTVTSTTLQILSLVSDLLEVKLPSLCNLKSLEVELTPLSDGGLSQRIKDVMLTKDADMSQKEFAKLINAFKARLQPPAIPDGIVDFLRQNSPSAEVTISTDFPDRFNLKQVKKSIRGAKIIKYRSKCARHASSSTAPASAAARASVDVPASAASPNLDLCCAEKDDKSSNEDKVEKHQPNSTSPLLDNEQ